MGNNLNLTCNICGSDSWADMGTRKNVRCITCGSLERTRALKLVLDRLGVVKSGTSILHMAPDKGLSSWFRQVAPEGYDPVDFQPLLYPDAKPRKFDLVRDCDNLETEHYDLIVHMHVLEHIPINIAYILHHLHRSLKKDGLHVFCIPIMNLYYDECFGPLSKDLAQKRFGQFDHVRIFGAKDLDRSIGSILKLSPNYSLYDYASADSIEQHNIPEVERRGLTGSNIWVCKRDDYKLWLT